MATRWIVAGSIVIAAFVLGEYYYQGESRKADAVIMKACMDHGGSFYVSWNWRPTCTLKATQ